MNPQTTPGPLISVVTALGRPEYDMLLGAGRSLIPLAQLISDRHPQGRDRPALEWIVCCDDIPDGQIQSETVADVIGPLGVPYRVTSTGCRAGPGPARNSALALASAPYLLTLDSDDRVVASGVFALLRELESDPESTWAAGKCYHVSPDFELIWEGPPDPWPEGRVAAGAFWQHKLEHGGLPFLCTAALARTAAIRACGGWPAQPRARAEDTALWAVLTTRWPGIWVAEHVSDYRRHPASVTQSPGFRAHDENLAQIARMVRAGSTCVR